MTFPTRPRVSSGRLALILGAVAFAVLFLLLPSTAGVLTDWWWFREIGYQTVFTTELTARSALFFVVGGFAALVLWLNLRLALRGLVPHLVVLGQGPNALRINLTTGMRRLSVPVALVLGLFAGMAATSAWTTVLQAMHGTAFGIADPVFGRDVGWYVFTLPALSALLATLSSLAVLCLVLVVPVFVLRGDIVLRPRQLIIERSAGVHLAVLLAVLLVLTAARLWMVDAANLLYGSTGPLVGASYTDLHARLPALRLSAVVAVVAAGAVVFGAARGRFAWYGVWSFAGYALVAVLGRGVVPAVMQQFFVAPTELTRETPYLQSHIAATRQAWGIDSVEQRDLTGDTTLTAADIRANGPTIDNVRLWDRDPLLLTFGQLQEIRTYYDFVSVDDDRYWINGQYRQVLLSPRELNVASLPTRTFINEHLTFTHGMGLTLGPVNQVTEEGLPVLFLKDLPPTSSVGMRITRPQIYYGELTDAYAFVGTAQREFDHPSGDENVYAAYQGSGGVAVRNLWRRLVLAVRFGKLVPGFVAAIRGREFGEGSRINLAIAVLIWLMIYPMMLKIDFSSLLGVRKRPGGLLVTLFVNWVIKPFSMAFLGWLFFKHLFLPWIGPELADQYVAGVIILAAAPCTAMVFVWSYLTDGDPAYTLVQVSLNDLIMLLLFAPIVGLLVAGTSNLHVPFLVLLYSVVAFIVIPLVLGSLSRLFLIRAKGRAWFENVYLPFFHPVTTVALLATLVLIFAFQADNLTRHFVHVLLIAVPILIQVYFNSGLVYGLMRFFKIPHNVAAPGALIGASNFFELAVAVAITLFGADSGAALATVVGVLVEVPVMLSVCAFCNRTRHWFPEPAVVSSVSTF